MTVNFEDVDQQPTLVFERPLRHRVEAVWAAITEPTELGQWFPCQVEVDLRLGGQMKFRFENMPLEGGPTTLDGLVTELDPPQRFSFLWGEDHLHFDLQPTSDGCLLRLTVELDTRDKAARDGAGWSVCLDALERQLDANKSGFARVLRTDPDSTPGRDDWRGYYEQYEERGFPTGAALPGAG